MRILIVIILMLLTALAHGQTHTMPGSNVVPSGASLTIQSGATITAAGGSTVSGFTSGLVIGTNVQAWDTDLDVWATVTPTAGIKTFLATPSSANLRGALTDENGTGAALFSGATTPDFTTGFTIGAAAASGEDTDWEWDKLRAKHPDMADNCWHSRLSGSKRRNQFRVLPEPANQFLDHQPIPYHQ